MRKSNLPRAGVHMRKRPKARYDARSGRFPADYSAFQVRMALLLYPMPRKS